MNHLTIGDLHGPAIHPAYLPFCQWAYAAYNCEAATLIGDCGDQHAFSRFLRHWAIPSVEDELERTREQLGQWHKAFPDAVAIRGNHDTRIYDRAAECGIPPKYIVSLNTLYGVDWEWRDQQEVDGCLLLHGHGLPGGKYAAHNASKDMGRSLAMGHLHRNAGVHWHVPRIGKPWFGASVGCGVDDQHPALSYVKFPSSMLGCLVLEDGHPHFVRMACDEGEPWHRSRFE